MARKKGKESAVPSDVQSAERWARLCEVLFFFASLEQKKITLQTNKNESLRKIDEALAILAEAIEERRRTRLTLWGVERLSEDLRLFLGKKLKPDEKRLTFLEVEANALSRPIYLSGPLKGKALNIQTRLGPSRQVIAARQFDANTVRVSVKDFFDAQQDGTLYDDDRRLREERVRNRINGPRTFAAKVVEFAIRRAGLKARGILRFTEETLERKGWLDQDLDGDSEENSPRYPNLKIASILTEVIHRFCALPREKAQRLAQECSHLIKKSQSESWGTTAAQVYKK